MLIICENLYSKIYFIFQSYSPQLHSPKRDEYSPSKYEPDLYATSLKSPARKQNDYYYNKENELTSKKHHDTDVTLISPRIEPKASSSYVTKNFSEKYVTRQRNESLSPIESPVNVS